MPNWCHNQLRVLGEPDRVAMFVDAVSKGPDQEPDEPQLLSFDVHRPTPPRLLEDKAAGDSGLPGWLEWRREHWGPKWDVQGAVREVTQDGAAATYWFVTPWRAPFAWLVFVASLLPHLRFELEYVEEFRQFSGLLKLDGGWPIEQGTLDPDSLSWISWPTDDEQCEEMPWE